MKHHLPIQNGLGDPVWGSLLDNGSPRPHLAARAQLRKGKGCR
eukprot:CAMPEP_0175135386 /NCGR_PEP_ID=MMETSP0087-20121206/8703_1 /TAXON_ID=136419 /ORGANISM="Unknown Unknown, Strain D1" /LENGTH=42 /DNA_ID= /DNA_START= /DNA_END= /DNA_ORIENTATION=